MSIIIKSNDTKPEPTQQTTAEAGQVEASTDTKPAPEASASEQNPPEVSETSETEEKDESATDSTAEESAEETEAKDDAKDKPKKKSGFQKRVDKLSARIADKEREAEYWKREALKSATEAKPTPVESAKPGIGDNKPNPDSFDTHAAYVEALTDWKVDQRDKSRDQKAQQERLQSDQAKLETAYGERAKSFAEKTPDFDEVLAEVDVPVSTAVRALILESDNGPQIAYELAKDKDELVRISKLNPLSAARELGKFESRFSSKTSVQETQEKKLTSAPKPLTPVGSGGKGSAPKSIYDPHISISDYERMRKEQMKKRRQAG